jgi:hypothetical protein
LVNKGKIAIKKIYIEGTLQTPGRSVPWVKESFNYEISGGVEPGESRAFSLAPNQFGAWGKVTPTETSGAALNLRLLDFEDPTGKRVGGGSAELLVNQEKSAKRIESLEAKITALETQTEQLKKK